MVGAMFRASFDACNARTKLACAIVLLRPILGDGGQSARRTMRQRVLGLCLPSGSQKPSVRCFANAASGTANRETSDPRILGHVTIEHSRAEIAQSQLRRPLNAARANVLGRSLAIVTVLSAVLVAAVAAPSTALMQAASTPTVVVTEQPGPPATSFAPSVAVDGLVAQPHSFALADLQALPQVTLPVVFGAGGSIQSATFTGPRLLDVLQAAGGPTFPAGKNGQLRTYVLAVGADNYQAVVSWASSTRSSAVHPFWSHGSAMAIRSATDRGWRV